MKSYICICYLDVLIAVLFTCCVFGCTCVLLPRSHKRGMIVVKLVPNCGKINMFKPNMFHARCPLQDVMFHGARRQSSECVERSSAYTANVREHVNQGTGKPSNLIIEQPYQH